MANTRSTTANPTPEPGVPPQAPGIALAQLALKMLPEVDYKGTKEESLVKFLPMAQKVGEIYRQCLAQFMMPDDVNELLAIKMLKDRALVWWETYKADYTGKSWLDILSGLGVYFQDPLEKQRLAEEFSSMRQLTQEEVRDFIGRWRDLLSRAAFVSFEYTNDTVWCNFTRGLNPRFKHALTQLDLAGTSNDGWPKGAEALTRWELRNPAPRVTAAGFEPRNVVDNSSSGHFRGNRNNHSSGNFNRMNNHNNSSSNYKKSTAWGKKGSGSGYAGPSSSSQAGAGGGAKARSTSSAGASSSASGGVDIADVKCFRCHKMGHYAAKCPEKSMDRSG